MILKTEPRGRGKMVIYDMMAFAMSFLSKCRRFLTCAVLDGGRRLDTIHHLK